MSLIWLVVVLALCIPLLGLVIDSPIGRGLGARLERNGRDNPSAAAEIAKALARLELLENEVDALREEVVQLREEQAFTLGLRAPDAGKPPLPPAGE